MAARRALSTSCRRLATSTRAPSVCQSSLARRAVHTSIISRPSLRPHRTQPIYPSSTRQRHFSLTRQARNEAATPAATDAAEDSAVQAGIAKAVKTSPVVLFMKGTPEMPQCGFSRATVQILGLQGVDPAKFTAFNVLEDNDLRQGIKKFSDWPTIPQLYVDDEFVGGCDILMSMHQDGSLAQLLADKGVVVEGDAEGETEAKS